MNPYLPLRQRVLDLKPPRLGPGATGKLPLIAGMMEMGMSNGVASLVVIIDGTTSMYWSTGGGIIGAGAQQSIKQPSRVFLGILIRHLAEMGPDTSGETPGAGMVHLRAITRESGRLLVAGPEKDFAEKRNPLWEVFYAGHALIAEMRKLPAVQKM
ncbi:MAG TPA: hypothetical protein VLS53_04240 [Candidatus Dormibacteraeota bacterium]|nr:hypothetical protein [Candidatus Dormibacteraeota bacterium]